MNIKTLFAALIIGVTAQGLLVAADEGRNNPPSQLESQTTPLGKTPPPQPAVQGGKINWRDYETGMRQGKNQNKKIFLHFFADWCGYCKKMKAEVFSQTSIADYLNQNFIAISVNSDRKPKIAEKYGVAGLPTTWFLTAKGEKISRIPGYIPEKALLNILRYFHTDAYKNQPFNDFLDER